VVVILVVMVEEMVEEMEVEIKCISNCDDLSKELEWYTLFAKSKQHKLYASNDYFINATGFR
jgi:hypothetical protein